MTSSIGWNSSNKSADRQVKLCDGNPYDRPHGYETIRRQIERTQKAARPDTGGVRQFGWF